ncbi:melanopsin isoform X5 [Echinops telfairi]|uniref:Melanopsin isoform X5 n=1 Tax=Echinops telfairi TaxID=9371 RepID=A0AC55DCG7_ECHTE|nr:melanopsin isoform X5 [Echinops telfairi]
MNLPSGSRVPSGPAQEPSHVATAASASRWNSGSSLDVPPPPSSPTAARAPTAASAPFPIVDVPDHVHYTLGTVILLVGLTGMLGNLMVIYTFCRSRSLRTPANMLIINLAVSDFLMSFTQAPVFFTSSLYKQWLFGEAGAYVPDGLLTSCSWDYMSFTPSVRAYTMLLFCFVFFLPLLVIIYCYIFIFRAIRETGRALQTFGACEGSRDSPRQRQRLQSEWKMAKIALLVISLFVLSWAPYSTVVLVAFAGYAHVLTPYMNSVPAVIAKASAIHNPIIYAITHPKYRMAIAQHLPCLGMLLGVSGQRAQPYTSYRSTRHSTLSSQASDLSWISGRRRQASLGSESDMGWTDTEVTATSGYTQQVSGRCPRGQDLESMDANPTPRPRGWETETAQKIKGLPLSLNSQA